MGKLTIEYILWYKQRNPTKRFSAGRASDQTMCVIAVATEQIPYQYLAYKFRLLPNRKQHADLARILEDQRQLYNGALEARISRYRKTGETLSHYAMCKQLTELRNEDGFSTTPVKLQRWTLRRLDKTYRAFLTRMRRGLKAKFPRYRGKGQWQSFGFEEFDGIRLKANRIHFKGMSGGLRVHMHRALPNGAKVVACTIGRDRKGWFVAFQTRVCPIQFCATGSHVGIDLGLKNLCFLSSGELIPNPQIGRRHERELRRRQRSLSRCMRDSKRRAKVRQAVTRIHAKIKDTRSTYLHQVSAKLVREHDVIAIEKLNTKGLASGMLAKSVNNAAWSILKHNLIYKAAYAGRQVIEVDPRNTTQACSGCGVIVPKDLSMRMHDCPHCGLSLDRDHNAAINILNRAVMRPGFANLPCVAA